MWTDEHLHWESDDFNGIDHIRVPHTWVWKPGRLLCVMDIFSNNKNVPSVKKIFIFYKSITDRFRMAGTVS
jgi:hypothetical protein